MAKGPNTFEAYLEDVRKALVKNQSFREEQAKWIVGQEQLIKVVAMSYNFGTPAKKAAEVLTATGGSQRVMCGS